MDGTVIIHAAAEGIIDEAVVQKLIVGAGGSPGAIYGKTGKAFLYQKIHGFNNAAKAWPWLVLVDLDNDAECAPPFCTQWVPDPSPYLCFRVAVREVESWLMADEETLASFLGLRHAIIPKDPEGLADPKREMVNLARRSRKEAIRKDMVPRQGSGRPVGPAYASRMIEYALNYWQPEVAARRADSLRRAIASLRRVIKEVVP